VTFAPMLLLLAVALALLVVTGALVANVLRGPDPTQLEVGASSRDYPSARGAARAPRRVGP
jgi:hypothetical protein